MINNKQINKHRGLLSIPDYTPIWRKQIKPETVGYDEPAFEWNKCFVLW